MVIFDRTLHMLGTQERIVVLERALGRVSQTGFVLIADERKNIPAMRELFNDSRWTERFAKKGFLFMQRVSRS